MIEAVLWDLGGVLCGFDPERRVQAIAQRSGCSVEEVAAVLDHRLLRALDRGEVGGAALHGLIRERLAWHCSYQELAEAWAASFEPNDAVLSIARRVEVPSGLLTDNGPPLSDCFRDVLPEIASVVSVAIFSGDTGRTKPRSEAYRAACRKLDARPSATLFIDDNLANVGGARAAGLQSLPFTTARAIEIALEGAEVLRSGPNRRG